MLIELYERARSFVSDSRLDDIRFPVFSWHEPFPESVGRAMQQGIDGPGGLKRRATAESLREFLGSFADLPAEIERWRSLEPDDLERAGNEVALPAAFVPKHVRAKFLEGGLFREKDGLILDRRKRPLTLSLFMKLTRMMLASFIRFSLEFQNTHPLLGVFLSPVAVGNDGSIYRTMGRVAAHMTLLARAQGYVSIIKSGPPEIAGDAIRALLAEQAPEPDIRARTAVGELEPVLTFQVGLPLGPDEPVCEGREDEHDGLKARLLDRRATRAPLSRHYVPAPDAD